ncbi:MAG: SDR family NAD(P)-dependent oxidoreductase [Devosia sp.]|nr:SDR family NAD(P)-dependent oxidoreductase [Devosia sp.]
MASSPLRVVILGAASGIAEATSRLYATEGAVLLLAGRNAERLEQIAADLKVRGAPRVEIAAFDLVAVDAVSELAAFSQRLGGIDHILLAYGLMTDEAEAERDFSKAAAMIAVNFTSASGWALAAANLLEAQGRGSLIVLGSPAGDRGRRKNFVYGATKAGLAVLVQGIAHRFAGKGPRAVLVKPGPTDTAMTASLRGSGAKLATPEQVAVIVRRAADRGGPIQYAPPKWRLIMRIVREIPAPIFDRLNF